jgi:hypothetical protein
LPDWNLNYLPSLFPVTSKNILLVSKGSILWQKYANEITGKLKKIKTFMINYEVKQNKTYF